PNSAGVVIDAIRSCKIALDSGIKGALLAPSAYLMKSPPQQGTDDNAHRRLARLACARPALTVAIAAALAIVSLVYGVTTLTFATSTRSLLPPGQPYVERFTQYDREFADLESIAIVVEAPSLPEATMYANRLVRELGETKVPLKQISYRIDPKQFEGRALLYLSKEKLSAIRERIFDYQEFMEAFAARPTLDQLVEGMGTQIANAFVSHFIDLGLNDGKGPADW